MRLNAGHAAAAVLCGLAVVVAGCIVPVPPFRTTPTLTLLGPGTCPLILQVSLTNNDPAPLNASVQGFWIGDSTGARRPANVTATHAFMADAFPDRVSLLQGAAAEGVVVFEEGPASPPYSLSFDFDGAGAWIRLNATAPGADPCANNTLPAPRMGLLAHSWEGERLAISVNAVANAPFLSPEDLSFVVASFEGSVCFEGVSGENSTLCGAEVSVSYQGSHGAGWPHRVSSADSVEIVASSPDLARLHGGSFTVFADNAAIGTVTIP